MPDFRFGLKKLDQKGRFSFGLKSKFGLKPCGCKVDFHIEADKENINFQFGNRRYVWFHSDGGYSVRVYLEEGEVNIPGVTVSLSRMPSGAFIGTQITDGEGVCFFAGLTYGWYRAFFDFPDGYSGEVQSFYIQSGWFPTGEVQLTTAIINFVLIGERCAKEPEWRVEYSAYISGEIISQGDDTLTLRVDLCSSPNQSLTIAAIIGRYSQSLTVPVTCRSVE